MAEAATLWPKSLCSDMLVSGVHAADKHPIGSTACTFEMSRKHPFGCVCNERTWEGSSLLQVAAPDLPEAR